MFWHLSEAVESFKEMFNSKTPQVPLPNPVRSFDVTMDRPTSRPTWSFVNVGRFAFQRARTFSSMRSRGLVKEGSSKRQTEGRPDTASEEASLRAEISKLGLDEVVVSSTI